MSTHIASRFVYLSVFVALVIMTAITVLVAFVDLGAFNTVLALGIACLKSALVLAFFMHLRYSERLNGVVALGGVFWFLILLGLTLSDFLARGGSG